MGPASESGLAIVILILRTVILMGSLFWSKGSSSASILLLVVAKLKILKTERRCYDVCGGIHFWKH